LGKALEKNELKQPLFIADVVGYCRMTDGSAQAAKAFKRPNAQTILLC